ncbi:MAG: DapH/DapD/GlmU-related protein [Pseudobdellovibrionaceae bacterium]
MRARNLPPHKQLIFIGLYVWDHFLRAVRKAYVRLTVQKCGANLRVFGNVRLVGHHNIIIGDRCALNEGVSLVAPRAEIILGNDVVLSPDVMVTTDSLDNSVKTLPRPHIAAPIRIKDGAWIGARAVILQGVIIGKNATVAAGAIVKSDVPDNALVAGIPAKIKHSKKA